MKLIYMWIEEYKCINKKEFRFSNKYDIKYSHKENTIEIKSNENIDHYNLYDETLNSFAVVGQNGSGKSSFVEALMLTISGMGERDQKKCSLNSFCIFEYKDKLYHTYSANVESHFLLPHNISTIDADKSDLFILHSNNGLEGFSDNFCRCLSSSEYCGFIYDLETTPKEKNFLSFPDKSKNIIDVNKIELLTKKMMVETFELYGNKKIDKFLNLVSKNEELHFKPDMFKLSYSFTGTYLKQFKNDNIKKILRKIFKDTKQLDKEALTNLTIIYIIFRLYESFRGMELLDSINENYIKDQKLINLLKDTSKLMNKISEVNKDLEKFSVDIDTNPNIIERNKEIIESHTKKLDEEIKIFAYESIDFFIYITKNINNIKNNLVGNSIKSLFYDIYKAIWYFEYIRDKKDNFEYFNKRSYSNNSTIELLASLPYFIEVDLWTITSNKSLIKFDSLSYGEKVLIRLTYNLLFYIEKIKNKEFNHLFIVFDELENGLSPKWQSKFFNFTYKILVEIQKMDYFKSITFIPITHSPFILSNFYKENIVFLNNCEQVPRDKETFGANIHTLLSDSFFMEEGLIGDFAKNKINEVIANLQGKEQSLSKEYMEYLIDSIGEPFLKTKLEELYDKEYSLDAELAKLKRQQDYLTIEIQKKEKEKEDANAKT